LHPKKRGLCGTTTLVSERHFWIRLGSALPARRVRASRVQCQSDSDFRRLAKTNFQLLLLVPTSAVNDAEGSWTENGKILSRNDGLQKPFAQ